MGSDILLSYISVVRSMLVAIPEIKPTYAEESRLWDEILPHVVFGDVVAPFVLELLSAGRADTVLKRTFDFFEEMASSEDVRVVEVLTVSVLERLGDDISLLHRAWEYMKPRTRMLSDEIERFWGRTGGP